jgi:hypothetical protein
MRLNGMGCAMRIGVAALLLSGGIPGYCQLAGTAPPSFDQDKKDPPIVILSQKGINGGSPVWQINRDGLLKMNVPPGLDRLRLPDSPKDEAMVLHPPKSSTGVLTPGMQVAQNLYPGLELMPIDQSKAKVVPIPTTFSNMKMEKIPTTWTQFKVSPIQSDKGDAAAK